MMRFLQFISVLLLSPLPAFAAESCLDGNLVLDLETSWDFSDGFFQQWMLPTHRMGQVFSTKTKLGLGSGADSNILEGIFEFPAPPNEVGLAYNLYRLQLQIGRDDEPDRQIVDQDYTGQCAGAGASLWPGTRFELKPVKITPHADGSNRGLEPVHLRFWGK